MAAGGASLPLVPPYKGVAKLDITQSLQAQRNSKRDACGLSSTRQQARANPEESIEVDGQGPGGQGDGARREGFTSAWHAKLPPRSGKPRIRPAARPRRGLPCQRVADDRTRSAHPLASSPTRIPIPPSSTARPRLYYLPTRTSRRCSRFANDGFHEASAHHRVVHDPESSTRAAWWTSRGQPGSGDQLAERRP